MSAFRLANELRIPRGQAAGFINTYFQTYSGVAKFIADTKKAAVGLLKGESSGFSDILGICPAAQAPGRATFSARCLTAS